MKVQLLNVTLNADIPKKDGGTYKGALMVFKNLAKNTIENKGISASFLDKNLGLKTKIAALTPGQEVELVFTKQGAFNNLTDIVEIQQTEETPQAKQAKGFVRNDPTVQRSIVRQSAVAQVVNLIIATGTVHIVDEELLKGIIEGAEVLAKYTGEGL